MNFWFESRSDVRFHFVLPGDTGLGGGVAAERTFLANYTDTQTLFFVSEADALFN